MNSEYIINKKNILVIGDVMLDVYYTGSVNRISPEAPVPVFKKLSERSVLGGAANVAANLIAANQNVTMITVVGKDKNGREILRQLKNICINTSLIIETDYQTTTKVRFIASNNQQVMRLDEEETYSITSEECNELLEKLKISIEKYDLIVISDYLKGLMTSDFTQGIIELANINKVRVFIDVKDSEVNKYKGAYLLKPNQKELQDLTGMQVGSDEEIILASKHLRKLALCDYVLTTCGARGMRLVGESEEFSVMSVGKEVFDVIGAGDTTMSYLTACAANNMDIKKAVEIANHAAGIQVSKVGTSAINVNEVYEAINSEQKCMNYKLIDQSTLRELRKTHEKHKIVFTNGCFDILHIGHIRYLQEAAKLGDLLVVGLNSDASVKIIKGESRPINVQKDRAELLCALEYVNYVVIFNEETPYELIKLIQPDVLVKGGDYKLDEVVGQEIVKARGGKVELIQFVEGKSTTNTIYKIMDFFGKSGRSIFDKKV